METRRTPENDLEAVLKAKVVALVRSLEEADKKPLTGKEVGDVYPRRWQEEGLGKATKTAVRQAIAAALMEGWLFEVVVVNPRNHKPVKYLSTSPVIGRDV